MPQPEWYDPAPFMPMGPSIVFERILVLCVGSICRSPMAETILRDALSGHGRLGEVRSAGLGALVGHPADEHVQRLMQRRGLDVSAHRAVQVNRDMLRWADLILVMEDPHRLQVRTLEPTVAGKVMLLGHWIGREIGDPFRQTLEVFEHTEALIDQAIDAWIKRL